MNETALQELTQAAYDAVEVGSWCDFLQKYTEELGADAGWALECDIIAGSETADVVGFEDGFFDWYTAEYSKLNIYYAPAFALPLGQIALSDALVPHSVARKTRFFNELVAPRGFHTNASICMLEKCRRGVFGLSFNYRRHRSDREIERSLPDQRLINPHVQAARQLQQRLRALEHERGALLDALDISCSPLALCDGRRRVLILNRSAERLLAARDGIGYRDGRLTVDDWASGRELGHSLEAACRLGEGRRAGAPGFMRLAAERQAPLRAVRRARPRANDRRTPRRRTRLRLPLGSGERGSLEQRRAPESLWPHWQGGGGHPAAGPRPRPRRARRASARRTRDGQEPPQGRLPEDRDAPSRGAHCQGAARPGATESRKHRPRGHRAMARPADDPAMNEQVSQALIHAVYDAVEVGSWNGFLQRYTEELGSDAGMCGERDLLTGSEAMVTVGFPDGFVDRHVEFRDANVYVLPVFALPSGHLALFDDLVAPAIAQKSGYFNEVIAPMGFRTNGSMCILEKSRVKGVGLALHYRRHRSDREIERVLRHQQLVIPHVQAAVRLQQRLRALELERGALLEALDLTCSPLAICEGRGRVLVINRSAERLLAAGDGLGYRDGRLTVDDWGSGRELGRSLEAACRLGEGRGAGAPDFVRVWRPSGKRPYELCVAPVPERTIDVRREGGRAYVFLSDPESEAPSSNVALQGLYGLTGKEAEVTVLLARGLDPGELAEHLRVGRETVKSHLRAVFQKTETRRQGELIAKVLRGLGRLKRTDT